jgi:hypothetical protein
MMEPRVVDARDGLTAQVIAGLGRAEFLYLSRKDAATGVLGYWTPSESPEGQAQGWVVLLPCTGPVPGAFTEVAVGRTPIESGAWLAATDLLHPGDLLQLRSLNGTLSLVLERGPLTLTINVFQTPM